MLRVNNLPVAGAILRSDGNAVETDDLKILCNAVVLYLEVEDAIRC
jgi:hypothetical protein